ncbi:MAG: YihY/virulence factor BrkB family protein [Candidatus Aureabacteria bacterium]|nr:YihY/virulence factor BrkB family protein [Candidatus Auribacterota bacterium]
MIQKLWNFLHTDIWQLKLKTLPRLKAIAILHLRVIVLSIKGFLNDKCQLHASALTFFSLLSIVPVLAFLFGLAKGFGFEKILETQITEKLGTTQPEVAEKLVFFSKNALENIKGGLIAGIGIVVLFWAVIKLLGNIENSFNGIWGVKNSRTWIRKITDYLSIVVFSFVLLVLALGMNIFIRAKLTDIASNIEFFSRISAPMFFLLKFTPYILLWLSFTFIYFFLPNTRVKFMPAFMGGIVAGTVFQLFQKAYIYFQTGVSSYNAIYGSLAALPLFLIWLQLSWLVVLFGAEISFSLQNHEQYEYEMGPDEISLRTRELASLRIVLACVENFCKGLEPLSAEELCDNLNIPIRIVRDILFRLTECRILSRICNKTDRFQPAKDVDTITISSVLEALRCSGKKSIDSLNDEKTFELKKTLEGFSEIVKNSAKNIPLKQMVS